jgi:hypothetical protein
MKVLKRMFTTIVPWYNEDSQEVKDKLNLSICKSAHSAISKAEHAIGDYRGETPLLGGGEHLRVRRR